MHAMGLHSALAIKRQRKRREEQKRARERRYSTQSTESGLTSPHNSMASLDKPPRARRGGGGGAHHASKMVTSVGMMHIGVVFLMFGAVMLVWGLVPSDYTAWTSVQPSTKSWFNELVVTGAFACAIGLFLVMLNRIISKREEDDLNAYVQSQLTRSRSGHRLVRDAETGCLTTRGQQRSRTPVASSPEMAPVHNPVSPPPLSPRSPSCPVPAHQLEQIVEEEFTYSEKGEEESRALSKEVCSNGSTTIDSLSPGSPSETQELLSARARFLNM